MQCLISLMQKSNKRELYQLNQLSPFSWLRQFLPTFGIKILCETHKVVDTWLLEWFLYFSVTGEQYKCSLINSHRRWYENDSIASNEQEWNSTTRRFKDLFVGFLVDFDGCDCFFGVGEHHVQMLIESLKIKDNFSMKCCSWILFNSHEGFLATLDHDAVSRISSHPSSVESNPKALWLGLSMRAKMRNIRIAMLLSVVLIEDYNYLISIYLLVICHCELDLFMRCCSSNGKILKQTFRFRRKMFCVQADSQSWFITKKPWFGYNVLFWDNNVGEHWNSSSSALITFFYSFRTPA